MEFMETCKTNQYDLAIVDPPYGIFDKKKCTGFMKENFKASGRGDSWDIRPDAYYFHEITRISKNQLIFGGNYFLDNLNICKSPIIWDKETPKNFFADGEFIWNSSNTGTMRIFKYSFSGFVAKHKLKRNKIHPTEKPVALYKWLLKNYAKPGQTIFDSHVGSGSIRIACHDMGFYFEGCELDPDYYQAQEERYQNHIAQGGLFETKEMQGLIYEQK